MAWQPQTNILDVSLVADKLFAYIEANHEDAINWATTGQNVSLAPFAEFHKSAAGRVKSSYPTLMLVDKGNATTQEGDSLNGAFSLRFEAVIKSGNTDSIATDASYYAKALESMLANVPSDVLASGAYVPMVFFNDSIETSYDELQRGTSASVFFQVFNTTVVYQIKASAY